jgi:hypothetical protein
LILPTSFFIVLKGKSVKEPYETLAADQFNMDCFIIYIAICIFVYAKEHTLIMLIVSLASFSYKKVFTDWERNIVLKDIKYIEDF